LWLDETVEAACIMYDAFVTGVLPQLPFDAQLPPAIMERDNPSDTWGKPVDAFLNACDDEGSGCGRYRYAAASAVSRGKGQKQAGPMQIGYTQGIMPDGSVRNFETPRYPTDLPWWGAGGGHSPYVDGTKLNFSHLGHVAQEPQHCCLRWERDAADAQWQPVLDPSLCDVCRQGIAEADQEAERCEDHGVDRIAASLRKRTTPRTDALDVRVRMLRGECLDSGVFYSISDDAAELEAKLIAAGVREPEEQEVADTVYTEQTRTHTAVRVTQRGTAARPVEPLRPVTGA
jgi:hypothetical protein